MPLCVVISSKILKALQIIDKYLESEDISWTLMGSVSLALQGVDVSPNDIDILTDKNGAFKIGALLHEYEASPVGFRQTQQFESFFGVYDIKGTTVEVIGDLRVKFDNTWVSLSDRLKSPIIVHIESMSIPVSSLKDQQQFYENLGREKDKECILKIREILN